MKDFFVFLFFLVFFSYLHCLSLVLIEECFMMFLGYVGADYYPSVLPSILEPIPAVLG